ncbi:MAG: DNA-directed RNA polymerase subunit beta [Candidatus Omnitrophica bacterium]|nr:DNA-directed RNA polymerase subunit beta [Candidatus Omnitrophota bacterium]
MKRLSYAKLKYPVKIPNLLDPQVESFRSFLQEDVAKTKRQHQGLEAVLQETFPIQSADGNSTLEYLHYAVGRPKYSMEECKRKDLTYSVPLRAKLRLRVAKEAREQEVYLCDLPYMTPKGTFIINGDERVVVTQMHRSPGVSFEQSAEIYGKISYRARIVPYYGSWLEFEFDQSRVLNVYIDRRRKFPATVLLRAFGYSSDEDILKIFGGTEIIQIERRSQVKELEGKILAEAISEGDQVIFEKYHLVTKSNLPKLEKLSLGKVKIIKQDIVEIINTLKKDSVSSKEEALIEIFRKMQPGNPATIENAEGYFERLFLNPKRYDLQRVGRFIINRKLGMKFDLDKRTLDKDTVVKVMEYMIKLRRGEGEPDDIDHLGSRRLRTVGELLQEQFRIGLLRIERVSRERMAVYDIESVMPHHLVNSKLISALTKDFFGRGSLSQFMDQTNPQAELTHRRRLSALGPGGLDRERAGFEVRDVHYSHYGRVCPIETPEGPNIGLITSLALYARINEFGFIETPYRKVKDNKVTNEIKYLTADEEDVYIIAQANARLDESSVFMDKEVFCRYKDSFIKVSPDKVEFMDVAPQQIVGTSTGLIPFLEHDDANRALMGANMMRQAVPLMTTESPYVGTGLEGKVAGDSGALIIAEKDGLVRYVDASKIIVGSQEYRLTKFGRTNSDTCINQRPLVRPGDKVEKGDILADGAATDNGEMALGRDVLVAFMPWRGYNFEDAVILSERLVKDDTFTSIHVEEFEVEARETKLGPEEITRDIPNVSEESLRNLDENGIVRIGAEVKPSDILVGKISPKTESELTPEEKLLRAIFGEKAGDVRDTSLKVPPGVFGVVIDVQVFTRKEGATLTKDEKSKELKAIKALKKEYEAKIIQLKKEKFARLSSLLVGKKLAEPLQDIDTGKVVINEGVTIKESHLKKLESCDLEIVKLIGDEQKEDEITKVLKLYDDQIEEVLYEMDMEISGIKKGDELLPGVLKKIVIHVASKRKVIAGDKVAGRHGNKGVVSRIVLEEDMPYLPDGTPIDIVLNPLGVPSRMNIGQILETHLGWAARTLNIKVASPVFAGATEKEIKDLLKKAGLPQDGKVTLYDGITGEPLDQKVTVGYIYIMKLSHMVDDKIHARSIGPYSLVTQQPLGGKAQFGGQRFGEMEVWALEAYGAAYTLQEMLTVKSDDVQGRTKIYESIVKGESSFQHGTPESLNVLLRELQGLALDVQIVKEKDAHAHSETKVAEPKAKKKGRAKHA